MDPRLDQGMMMGGRGGPPNDPNDPKNVLIEFCQKFCKRPIAKHDIQYNSAKVHPNGMQATVKLLCLQGQEFAGEICGTPKDAERSAAQQALQFYGMDVPRQPPPPMGGGMSGMAAQQLLAMGGGLPGQGRPGQGLPGQGPPGGQGMFNPAFGGMMGGPGGPPGGGFPGQQNFGMPPNPMGGMGGDMGMPPMNPMQNRGPRITGPHQGGPGGGNKGMGKGGKGGQGGGKGKGGMGDRPMGFGRGGGPGMGGRGGGDRNQGKDGGRGKGGGRGGAPPAGRGPPPQDGEAKGEDGDVDTSKSNLNVVCMKLLKRPMQKGEIVYDSPQTPGGFQSVLRLPCLPEPWGGRMWTGKVCSNRKSAEQDAAEKALADIKGAPEFQELLSDEGKPPKKKDGDKEGGKGKGKGKKGKMAEFLAWLGKGGMKGGPDLEREPVGEAPVSGEVIEWKGSFGWIKPAEGAVQHEALQRRNGKIYVHKKDLPAGTEGLEAGQSVNFKVYLDTSGLGASDVTVG